MSLSNPIKSAAAPNKRPSQVVLTPQPILDVCLALWGSIEFDPYPAPGSPASTLANVVTAPGSDGHTLPWPDKTYANPPFAELRIAMAHAKDLWHSQCQILLLGPARTHRAWFWLCRGEFTAWLKPMAFHGHKSTFPFPLCLHYYGTHGDAFRQAVRHLAHEVT